MNYNITKSLVLTSLLWKLLERGGTQAIQFFIMILLARILLPENFGLMVLVTIFITIASVFVQSGFNTALIQKKDADEVDFSSVFFLSLIFASLLYTLIFFMAPVISAFFKQPDLASILRIISLTLFFGAVNSIQNAVIARKLQFKRLFFSSIGAIIVSGTVGIIMAFANYGVWALVALHLTNQFSITIILWFTLKWRPQLVFSFERIKNLFSFGWKLLISNLIDNLYNNFINLLIGKIFSPSILGYYNRAEQFPQLIVTNLNGSIQSVMFPAFSSQQHDILKVKGMVRRSIVSSSFVIFPMMVGLSVVAEPLVKLLLTDKWLPAVPFLQIFCAVYALWPIHTANLQAINALGRSDIFLKLEIVKIIFGLFTLLICLPFGVYIIAFGLIFNGVVSTFINAYPNMKLLNYSFIEQLKDIIPSLLISLFMGGIVYVIHFLNLSDLFTLLIQLAVGVIVYIGLAVAFKLECFNYLIRTMKEFFKRKKSMNPLIKE